MTGIHELGRDSEMSEIDILIAEAGTRRWQLVLAERLAAAGHDVRLVRKPGTDEWPAALEMLLSLEATLARGPARLSTKVDAPAHTTAQGRPGALVIDLSGAASDAGGATLVPVFDGSPSASAAAAALAAGKLPVIALLKGGRVVAEARPMVDSRIMVGRGLEDVLARTISLVAASVEKHLAGTLRPLRMAVPEPQAATGSGAIAGRIASSVAPRLARESVRRLSRWPFHWRVGYRFHDGRGVAETGMLGGADWSILPDDGQRYYADPFAFERDRRHFLFVEEFPHATGKGIISVAEFGADRRPSVPRPVLEEPFHLSYPQVFSHGGETWMLPEGGAGRGLILYRAERFPDHWVRHAVLVEDRELFDATLLEHGGRLWLLAAERDGMGSTSDVMVVFHADRLEGPWTPHRANPILIDRAAARPGGAFAKVGRRIVRPVQDGTGGYGGGLGLSDLIRLDEDAVQFSMPVGILPARNWPHPRIHTLNRAGTLEVIDGIAEVKRRGGGLQAA